MYCYVEEKGLCRQENEERAAECEELRAGLERSSTELAAARRRAEAVAGELSHAQGEASRAEVWLRSAEAQKASLAAEVALQALLKIIAIHWDTAMRGSTY